MERSQGDAGRAALLSAFVVPGAGQIYNGQWLKGLMIAVVSLVSFMGILIPIGIAIVNYYVNLNAAMAQPGQYDIEQVIPNAFQPIVEMANYLVILLVVAIILYIYSIIDAYSYNRKQFNNETSIES